MRQDWLEAAKGRIVRESLEPGARVKEVASLRSNWPHGGGRRGNDDWRCLTIPLRTGLRLCSFRGRG